ncbi:S1C family serine protease [candidate division CSSED10-310 bacterium]|uniref:S1C family serine protease n=1 Tax=candidate division CSSED10-310 bacterium TaxID=2855610 RepID=A0ABV6YRF3_UNCC1
MTNLYENYDYDRSQKQREYRGPSKWKYILIALPILIAAGYMFFFLQRGEIPLYNFVSNQTAVQSRSVTPVSGPLGADEQSTINIFKTVSPSVVFITSISQKLNFFNMEPYEIPQGNGSGFIWDTAGHIVTNYHVVHQATKVSVTLSDHSTWKATKLWGDIDHDVAVLHIEAPLTKLQPVTVGTSNELQVGQKVLAIGNPFGLDSTLTTGIISALGRSIRSTNELWIHGVIQTDAAINPGNSGGPLLDSFGRVIGMNTAIVSPSGGSAGIGFAVPIDTINRIVPQLISRGKVSKAGLGITLFSDEALERWGIQGALIRQVNRGSTADNAGLKGTYRTMEGIVLGDIIVAIDGEEIKQSSDLVDALTDRPVGTEVKIEYIRNNRKMTTSAILQELQN